MRFVSLTTIAGVLLTIALLTGLFDAIYLSAKHFSDGLVVCTVADGCNIVLESSWSTIFGIPVALFGVGYYGLLLFCAVSYWWWRDSIVLKVMLGVATVGILITLWFLYLQLEVINAVCEYCLLSAVSTLIAWGSIAVLVWKEHG